MTQPQAAAGYASEDVVPPRGRSTRGDRVRTLPSFAAAMALGMLAVNAIGFAPTLYLRPLFDVPPIPLYLYLHGVLGTAWFMLLLIQTLLAASHRVTLHRRLGGLGVVLGVGVLASGIYTSMNMVPRNAALGATEPAEIQLYGVVTAADLAQFIVFPVLVGLAVYFRNRRDVHKRLLLIASIAMLGPAVARIASWYGPFPNPVSAALIWSFLLAMLAYDLVTRRPRRPHVATVFGIVLFLGTNLAMQLSGIGPALVARRLLE